MNQPIGVALFGLGRAGMIHSGNILKNYRCQLLYIVEIDINKANEAVEKYYMKGTKVIRPEDIEEIYNDSSVQAVVVCTPTFAHEEIVRGALQNGKAVFCEKPISEDTEGTKTCYEIAESTNKPLICSFNRRFDPSLKQLRARVKSGECGKIYTVKTCARDHPLPPLEYLKISGGFYHDCAVHDIDLVCWILGEFPCSVFVKAQAHNKDIKEMGDVDTTLITLMFPSGVMASIDLSRNAVYGYDQRCEVFGEDGMLVSQNQRPTEIHYYDRKGSHQDPLKWSFPQRYADSYWEALEHFFNVVEGKESPEITKTETLNVSKIAAACEESLKLGKEIELSL